MKVRELMELLSTMDENMEVRFLDTFWESEGWGEHAHDDKYMYTPVCEVDTLVIEGQQVVTLR